jgi:(1->4)-alpha-D-glucan 1-alpha-D-glucosylmutase
MVVPGVPDFYQGTELWDLSLVDPDNRRPVDYEKRSELVRRCKTASAAEVLGDWDSGLPKIWMTSRLMKLRREQPEYFSRESKYQPLVAQGAHLGNLFAFRRGENLVAVVPRFTMSVQGSWGDTSLPLPRGIWRDFFTEASHESQLGPDALFRYFPVALLIREES